MQNAGPHAGPPSTRAAQPADTGTPPARRLAVVGFVVDNGFLSQSIGQQTTSKRTRAGRYTLVVKGLDPGCTSGEPKVVLTPDGVEGKAKLLDVSTGCGSGDVTARVGRTTVAGNPLDGAFYFAAYRGAGPRPAGVANPKGNRVAVGKVSVKGELSKVDSEHALTGRRYGRGRFDVTVRGLDQGCTSNAPLTLVNVLKPGVALTLGAGVDCRSGDTSLPFNIYSPGGEREDLAFTFTVYRGQPMSETTRRPIARCRLAADAEAAC